MNTRLAVIGCAWTFAVHAQAPASPQAEAANPAANPAAKVTAPAYSSAYTGYRGWRDETPAAWREANDEAARIGGHLGMFKPQPQAPAATHAGHHGQHGGTK